MGDTPIPLDFGTGSDTGRYGPDTGPRHLNAYVEPVVEGKHPAPIYADDGLALFTALSSGGKTRGMKVMDGVLYVLSGTALYSVTSAGVATLIGSLAGTSNVSMDCNAAATPQLVIVADGNKYKVESSVLSQITDVDLPAAVSCTFLNSRIIYGISTGKSYFSAIDDADDISSLDFFTAEGDPDTLVATVQHLQQLRVFGSKSVEVFTDTGDATAPFRRMQGAVIPRGCIGINTIASIDTHLFWVGDDGVVYGGPGYEGNRVSHFGVEDSIRTTSDKSTIEAMSYHYMGHAWYVLSGPDWTWSYNRTTGRWHERESYGIDRWRASHAVEFAGMVVVGDYAVGNLYTLSKTAYDEAGEKMVWRVRSGPMHAFPNQYCIDRLYLDFATGVGLNSTDAHLANPQVGLRWSDNGGKTWSNQKLKPLGRIGSYSTRVTFEGLGMTGVSGRIWEIEVSSPVARCLMYAAFDGDPVAA